MGRTIELVQVYDRAERRTVMARRTAHARGEVRVAERATDYERGYSEGYEKGQIDGMAMLVLMVLVILVAGYCGGLEAGTIPLPWEIWG